MKNASDGINLVQIADAALEESIDIVHTIKTKAIQAAQDGQTKASRQAIQADIDKLMQELDTIARTTSFNNKKLLSGAFANKMFQTGSFAGETTCLSISSSESGKIGHVTTTRLALKEENPGVVDLSIFSNVHNKSYNIAPVEIAFDNTPEHGMGAVADAINRMSSMLGVSAKASVAVTTMTGIAGGVTGKKFSINGINIGQVAVEKNDGDGALVNAINSKSASHGVMASVEEEGRLTLSSFDGRAIRVKTGDESSEAVLGNSQLVTAGYLTLIQEGTGEIVVDNVGGGDALALTDPLKMDTPTSTKIPSILKKGSVLAKNSVLAPGWRTGQGLCGTEFSNTRIDTTQLSTFTQGSFIPKNSSLGAGSAITGQVRIDATASTRGDTTMAKGSILKGGTQIGEGTIIGGHAVLDGSGSRFTRGESLVRQGSILASGSVVAQGSELGAGAVIEETSRIRGGGSQLAAGTVLSSGSIIGADSVLGGDVTLGQNTSLTSKDSVLEFKSTIASGSTIGANTLLGCDIRTGQDTTTSTHRSLLTTGTTLGSGTILGADTIIGGTLVLGEETDITSSKSLVRAGSILGTGALIGKGTIVGGTVILSDQPTEKTTRAGMLAYNSRLTAGSLLCEGTVLKPGETIITTSGVVSGILDRNYMTSGVNILSDGGIESLARGSYLGASSWLGQGSYFGADVIIEGFTILTEDMTLSAGSRLGRDTLLTVDSRISEKITNAYVGVASIGTVLAEGATLTD